MNAVQAYKYINNELKVVASNKLIKRVYKEMRIIICKTLKIEFQNILLGNENEGKYYSVDETLISHFEGKQILLLGICNNNTKEFRIEASYNRNMDTLREFITSFVKKGNYIITDSWPAYSFLDKPGSGYRRIKHIHGGGDFSFGIQLTSTSKVSCPRLKAKLKRHNIYIPMLFL